MLTREVGLLKVEPKFGSFDGFRGLKKQSLVVLDASSINQDCAYRTASNQIFVPDASALPMILSHQLDVTTFRDFV